MATYKTQGIVLGRLNLGEADRIVTFLTPDLGKLKAIAKGSRRIKSKLGPHLELFYTVDLVLAKGRNLDIVTGARLVSHQPNLVEDVDRLSFSYLMAEMVGRLVDEGTETGALFEMVSNMFEDLGQNRPDPVAELYLKLNFLAALGYHPILDHCVNCGLDLVAEQRYWFNPALGGVVDEHCVVERGQQLGPEQIKLWRLMLDKPLTTVRQVDGIQSPATQTLGVVDDFYDHTFGRRFTMPNLG